MSQSNTRLESPPQTAIFWDTDPHTWPTGLRPEIVDKIVNDYSVEPLRHLTSIFYDLALLENPEYFPDHDMVLSNRLQSVVTWYASESDSTSPIIQTTNHQLKENRLNELISECTRILHHELPNPQSLTPSELRIGKLEELLDYESESNILQFRLFSMLESIEHYDPSYPPEPLTYPFKPTEIDDLIDLAGSQPFLESSNNIRRLEWSVRSLYNQVNTSPYSANEMSDKMLEFYRGITPQLQEQGETKDIWTDSNEMRQILMRTIEQFWQEGIIPRDGRFLIVGVGNGAIDLQAMLNLGIDPNKITAIDILDKSQTGDHSKFGITYADNTNLVDWAPEHQGEYDCVVCTSTGTVNEENFLFHFIHFQSVQKMLNPRGVYLYEARNLEVDPDHNDARTRAILHSQENPDGSPNTTYINPKYVKPGSEKEFGASIEPIHFLQNIFELVGFEPLNYIFRLPNMLRSHLRNYPASIIDSEDILVSPIRTAVFEPGNHRITLALAKEYSEQPILQVIIDSVSKALSSPRRSRVRATNPLPT